MADAIKAQKLAAARKMLKQFQQKSHKPPKENKENVTPREVQSANDSLTSSTHSLDGNQAGNTSGNAPYWTQPVPEEQTSHLQNYFAGGESHYNQTPVDFFDSYAQNAFQNVNNFQNPLQTNAIQHNSLHENQMQAPIPTALQTNPLQINEIPSNSMSANAFQSHEINALQNENPSQSENQQDQQIGNSNSMDYVQNYANYFQNTNSGSNINQFGQVNNLNSLNETKSSFINQISNAEPVIPSADQFFAYEIRDEDAKSEDYPELQHNEIFNRLNNLLVQQEQSLDAPEQAQEVQTAEAHPESTTEAILGNIHTLQKGSQDLKQEEHDHITGKEITCENPSIGQVSAEVNSNMTDNSKVVLQETHNVLEHLETQENSDAQCSPLESLNQLSSQLHHLVNDYESYDLKHNNELEKRNQELVTLLNQERIKSEQLRTELNDCKIKILQLESESQQFKIEHEKRISQELGPLQEQLQYHMQTVGILVAEKTELTASLSQSQIITKQKTSECEDLQEKLKSARAKALDLEKELNTVKAEKSKFDKFGSEKNEEVNSLQKELESFKEQKEEVMQDLSELREKFNISASDNLKLQHEIQELTAQLSLANVKIQQLSAGESMHAEMQLEELMQQKLLLEKHVAELHQSIKTVTNERDQASVQYQQYTQQLNSQLSNIAQKLEITTQQNEALAKREQDLVAHIGELEKHLQGVQNDHVNFSAYKNNNGLKKELEDAQQTLEELKKAKDVIDEKLESYRMENEDLLKELANKKDLITELENKIERLEGNQPDSAKLLAAMESDKVAAARAVTQNTQLKKQLEDMEEVFIKISNDKLELTEQLTSAQHKNKDLNEKLSQVEHQLHTLAEAIEIKDRELTLIRDGSSELNKQVVQQNQLTDRLRHYEAQEHAFLALKNELQEAQHEIDELKKENVTLKQERLILNTSHQKITENSAHMGTKQGFGQTSDNSSQTMSETQKLPSLSTEGSNTQTTDKRYELLQAKVDELETINIALQEKLRTQESHSGTDINVIDKGNNVVNNGTPTTENNESKNYIDKEDAMRKLEEKFKKTMEEIATLQDEKQRLEHVVTQLQGETETIGEYIALYQHQRGVLNQRAMEKEMQLKKIIYDREQMRMKLEQLNALIRRLIIENGTISPEIMEEHRQINQDVNDHEGCTDNHSHHHCIEPAAEVVANGVVPNSDSTYPSIHNSSTQHNIQNLAIHNQHIHNPKTETAQKIIELLSEIKSNTLVSPSELSENFHPCPCCSGLLITV